MESPRRIRAHPGWSGCLLWLRLGALVLGGLCCALLPAHAAVKEARILILNGTDPYLPGYLAFDSALRANLTKDAAWSIVLFSEALDGQRFAVEALEHEYLALLSKKYRALSIDVVVAVTRPALEFFVRNGERLWPGARVVYQGSGVGMAGHQMLPLHATGVLAPEDVEGTIALARRMQPRSRQMMVITGASDQDRRFEQLARKAVTGSAEGLSTEFLSGLPQAELVAAVAAAPPDTMILFLTQFRDRDGRPYTPRVLALEVIKVAQSPVYSISETFVGTGAVAGMVEVLEERGRLVAERVLDALAGRVPDPARAMHQIASRCVADARALKRLSLDASLLPEGCEIRFADRSIWDEYFWVSLGAIGVLAAQSLLIAVMRVQMRRRRAAEAEARKRFSEMAHMNRRVAMGEMSASIAHELNQPLGAIRNNAGAAELLLDADPPRLRDVKEILNDIKRDDQRASDIIARIRKMLVKAEFQVRDIDLNVAIDETTALLAEEAALRGVTIRAELVAGLPQVCADAVEVKQVVVNLALNAMEAMHDQPPAQRRLTIQTRCANDHEAEVSVRDSGAGIPSDLLPRIFEAFVTSKASGMGLGLAISRTIIETHGGRMRAENGPEGGAIISFTLPFAVAAPA